MNRRELLKLGAVAAGGAALGLPLFAADDYFLYPESSIPIIDAGQTIVFSQRVKSVEPFAPNFGAQRAVVNPASPVITGRNLTFLQPGEYYIRVNKNYPLKVLVLGRGDAPSVAILRFFDFSVANLVWGSMHDPLWYNQRPAVPRGWMQSSLPLVLSCGPTHQLFRDIIRDRFGLPTRIYTIPGMFYRDGQVYQETHNVPEVFLPDLGKWVMFDLNNAYVPRWLSATELADKVSSVWGAYEQPNEELSDLGIELHAPMRTWMLDEDLVAKLPADEKVKFDKKMLWRKPLDGNRRTAIRLYRSGVAYWGGASPFGESANTWFLPFDYAWVYLGCDPNLREDIYSWIEGFGRRIDVVSPSVMTTLLDAGHAPEIARTGWKHWFPNA